MPQGLGLGLREDDRVLLALVHRLLSGTHDAWWNPRRRPFDDPNRRGDVGGDVSRDIGGHVGGHVRRHVSGDIGGDIRRHVGFPDDVDPDALILSQDVKLFLQVPCAISSGSRRRPSEPKWKASGRSFTVTNACRNEVCFRTLVASCRAII